jgi:hypothetical protein
MLAPLRIEGVYIGSYVNTKIYYRLINKYVSTKLDPLEMAEVLALKSAILSEMGDNHGAITNKQHSVNAKCL